MRTAHRCCAILLATLAMACQSFDEAAATRRLHEALRGQTTFALGEQYQVIHEELLGSDGSAVWIVRSLGPFEIVKAKENDNLWPISQNDETHKALAAMLTRPLPCPENSESLSIESGMYQLYIDVAEMGERGDYAIIRRIKSSSAR